MQFNDSLISALHHGMGHQTTSTDPGPCYRGIHTYTTHVNTVELLHGWEGKSTVLFYPTLLHDQIVQLILKYTDYCLDLYRTLTGLQWPRRWPEQFPGKAPLAIVQKTCGAGCGCQGIAEIQWQEHQDAVIRLQTITHPVAWQVGFYEFGRQGSSWANPTFPFYRAIDFTQGHDLIASAFPEYVAGQCIAAMGCSLEQQRDCHRRQGYHRVPGPLDYRQRFLDSGWSFTATLEKDHPSYFRNWPLTSLFSHLHQKYGMNFMVNFIASLNRRGEAGQVTSPDQVASNLLAAAADTRVPYVCEYLEREWKIWG